MNFEEYRKHDAVGLAGLVSKGEVSPSELLETAVARMAAVNPKINAVTMDLTEWGRQDVKRDIWGGPMAGVPFLLKDLGAQLEGAPTTVGSAVFRDATAAADSAITTAYKDAGLVLFGKTNTPEFGLMPVTEPALLGVCRNPWDTGRTPGGSSGARTVELRPPTSRSLWSLGWTFGRTKYADHHWG